MQPMRYLNEWLSLNSTSKNYLFSSSDLRALFPQMSDVSFKTLLSRSVSSGLLTRVCRGIYLYKRNYQPDGAILFHVAKLLRANELNYISAETALSYSGVISQIPMNRIVIISSGRSNIIDCGEFGVVEFIHTSKTPDQILKQITYDYMYGMWCATTKLAIQDMKYMKRNTDLINWDIANELI